MKAARPVSVEGNRSECVAVACTPGVNYAR